MRRGCILVACAGAALVALGVASALPAVRWFWSIRASNPVRRGMEIARTSGCFSCHGVGGTEGIPDPALPEDPVPGWGGGLWMMYVQDEAEVREYVLEGTSRRRAASASGRDRSSRAAINMPAYRDALSAAEVDDVVAAFTVLSGMRRAPDGTPEAGGEAVAERFRCGSCHGLAGSGGIRNPGSFTGTVPGWYGPEFKELVRDRTEFDAWIAEGTIPRLEKHPVASRFMTRQRLAMPKYDLSASDRDALWAYFGWLERTRGGLDSPPRAW